MLYLHFYLVDAKNQSIWCFCNQAINSKDFIILSWIHYGHLMWTENFICKKIDLFDLKMKCPKAKWKKEINREIILNILSNKEEYLKIYQAIESIKGRRYPWCTKWNQFICTNSAKDKLRCPYCNDFLKLILYRWWIEY